MSMFDMIRFWGTRAEVKDEEHLDSATKEAIKTWKSAFSISVDRDETGRKILGTRVTMFGGVVVVTEDLSALNLHECNDVTQSVQLQESFKKCFAEAAAKFLSPNYMRWSVEFLRRYRERFPAIEEEDKGSPF